MSIRYNPLPAYQLTSLPAYQLTSLPAYQPAGLRFGTDTAKPADAPQTHADRLIARDKAGGDKNDVQTRDPKQDEKK